MDFLETLNVPCYKVASFENTDLPLIRKIAATGKPMIISTGMATIAEIAEAVETARTAGCRDIVLLKCTSTYPATPENTNIFWIMIFTLSQFSVVTEILWSLRIPDSCKDFNHRFFRASSGHCRRCGCHDVGSAWIEKHFTLAAGFRVLTAYAMNRFISTRRHGLGERLLERDG